MATWQITLLILLAIYLYRLLLRPVLRKKYPNTFKTPVTITSYDQVVGKDEDGKDITYAGHLAREEAAKGMDYMDAGDYRAAVRCFTAALDAGIKEVRFLRAECYEKMAYYVEAVQEMDLAIAENPSEFELYRIRAEMRVYTGNFEGIEADRQKAFELIQLDNATNWQRNENAKAEGYSSLTDKYEDIFRKIEDLRQAVINEGPPAPNPGSVAVNNKGAVQS